MLEPPPASSPSIRVLLGTARCEARIVALGPTPFGRFDACGSAAAGDAIEADLLVLAADDPASAGLLEAFGHDIAAVVVDLASAQPEADTLIDWLQRGALDMLDRDEWAGANLPRRLRVAVERKRLERLARTEYATDLDTGLPHQQQLVEHMSQLLALREREPAPMAVLAIRLEGLASAEAQHGREAAGVLRRKIAVRLRSGVRASDVVASLADDSFAVLLGSVLTPADAERVGEKLLRVLVDPFKIAGTDVAVAAALGIGRYPEDGTQPEVLLRRATGLAASALALGRAGFARFGGAEREGGGAANDEA